MIGQTKSREPCPTLPVAAPSFSSSEVRRSIHAGHWMIDWLLNDILWGGDERGLVFLLWFFWGQGSGYCNASLTLILGGIRGQLEQPTTGV